LNIINGKWMKRIFGGLSFTAALFVFEACHGTPQDLEEVDLIVDGTVKSEATGLPVGGSRFHCWTGINISSLTSRGHFLFTPG
jgi:hypothetical protein